MENQALKKYSPLVLLALAIVAGVVGIVAKSVSDDAKDAGFDVIGYFYCENRKVLGSSFVLIAEDDTFEVLEYRGYDEEVISRGKPTDLRLFTRQTIHDDEISYSSFNWKDYSGVAYSLDRSLLTLVKTTPGIETPEGEILRRRYSARFNCKFGEEGKKLVWKDALEEYELLKRKF